MPKWQNDNLCEEKSLFYSILGLSCGGGDKFITARKRSRSLGQGNIFIGVCQEFCSWGGVPGLGGACSRGGTWWTPPTATAAGGTHPVMISGNCGPSPQLLPESWRMGIHAESVSPWDSLLLPTKWREGNVFSCVCLSVSHSVQGEGVPFDHYPWCVEPRNSWTVSKWAVGILLECFLVITYKIMDLMRYDFSCFKTKAFLFHLCLWRN